MVKPLRSDDPAPQNIQFKHFGILNDGTQSRGSLFSSIAINVILAIIIIIIGAAVHNTIAPSEKKVVTLIEPLPLKPPPPPKIIHTPPIPKPVDLAILRYSLERIRELHGQVLVGA